MAKNPEAGARAQDSKVMVRRLCDTARHENEQTIGQRASMRTVSRRTWSGWPRQLFGNQIGAIDRHVRHEDTVARTWGPR